MPGQTVQKPLGLTQGGCGKNGQLQESIEKEKCKLMKIQDNPEYDNGIQEDIKLRIADMNGDPSVRQESIDLLKGRLKDQITGIMEMIAKVLDKDTSLVEKIQTLFREQGKVFWLKLCFLVEMKVGEEVAQCVSLLLRTKNV